MTMRKRVRRGGGWRGARGYGESVTKPNGERFRKLGRRRERPCSVMRVVRPTDGTRCGRIRKHQKNRKSLCVRWVPYARINPVLWTIDGGRTHDCVFLIL